MLSLMTEVMRAQVAVVGSGPTGAATALALQQRGIEDVLLLDVHEFPRDKTCGSGLSPRAIEILHELGVWSEVEPLAYMINGLRLVTRRGNEALVSAGDEHAAAICLRRDFDYVLHLAAIKRGARFVPHFKATQGLVEDDHGHDRWVGVRAADGREVRADFVVMASGAHARLTSNPTRKRAIHTIMGWWEDVEFTPHHVEMLWDDLVLPCYGWLFPEAENRVNIGITYDDDDKSKNARQIFQAFLDKHYRDRVAAGKQIGGLRGFPIVYTYRSHPWSSPGRLIAGEAGRLTHPATGEGISQGMGSALFAADAIADVSTGRTEEIEALRRYDRRCARTFLPSFWAGKAFRGLLHTPLLDWIVKASSIPSVQRTTARLLAHF
jgi:geranylgeranyl reductase family protein